MEQKVFITKVSAFLPNEPVLNEDMESYLGKIGGIPSRVKKWYQKAILRSGCRTEHHAQ